MMHYKYTTANTCFSMISNGSLRFGCLAYQDDKTEGRAYDFSAADTHFFTSSWTANMKINDRLFKMYGDHHKGVRIGIPAQNFNFEKKYKSDPNSFPVLIKNFINSGEELSVMLWEPNIIKVQYDKKKINRFFERTDNINFGNMDKIVRTKSTYWEWQNEYRFILAATDREVKSTNEILRDIFHKKIINQKYIDLFMPNLFLNAEILIGKKCPMKDINKIIKLITDEKYSHLNIKICYEK